MIDDFLAVAGWSGAELSVIPGDASFRRYYRVNHKAEDNGLGRAMLMVAPPPEEDVRPFLQVAEYLDRNGLRAPEIFAADADTGLVLLEDFGTDRMREAVDEMAAEDEATIYRKAVKTLTSLHRQTLPSLQPYDSAVYQREALLFNEWYCPAQGLDVDKQGFVAALDQILEPVLATQDRPVVVLRDYHAENIMLLEEDKQGLLDFQDALLGHPAYDLVSLLQDARRDVSEVLEREMCDYFVSRTRAPDQFLSDYAVLGAQRNLKIIGIFTRLMKRDGKDRYLDYIPRVWRYLERDLAHPACAPMAEWFAANIPDDYRQGEGLIDRLKA
ncbi:MAG: phosphotransferase [Pseudomonadota bacterium]